MPKVLLVILLCLPAILGLIQPGYFSMHDDLQIFRLYELDKCVRDFQIPCRWVPDGGYGYGYPLMQYYPPFPYYPAEILHLLGLDFFWSIKIMFILAFLTSGVAMYFLSKKFFGHLPAIVSAIFYVYAPYHSVDIYVRGALNEAWGMVWFPLVFLYSFNIIDNKQNARDKLKFSLSFAGLLLSHNVMTLIFSPALGVWCLLWLIISKKWFKILDLFQAGILSIGIAAFFFLPVVLEGKYVHVDSMTVGYFNYLAHFADLKQMFFSRFWGYGGSVWGPEDEMAFPIGHFHWIVAFVSTIIAIIKFKKNSKISAMIVTVCLIGLGFVFLSHSRSVWFWDHLPLLYFAQFPWRLLAMVAFAFSFLSAAFFYYLTQAKVPRVIFAVGLTTLVILWNLPFFKIDQKVNLTIQEKLSGQAWDLQVTGGIFDYLPRSAPIPPGDPAPIYPHYIAGDGGIINYKKGTNWQSFQAKVSTDNAQIVVPLFNFPGMNVTINNEPVTVKNEPSLGRILIDLKQGVSKVNIVLKDTPLRTISNAVSIISMVYLIYQLLQFHHESK